MNIRHLRYFLVLAEEMHFGRAAARLALSQPPLSRTIRQLEEELGVDLIDRSARPLELTPSGHALKQEVSSLLHFVTHVRFITRRASEGLHTRARIGFTAYMACLGLRDLVLAAERALPGLSVRLLELPPATQPKALRDGLIDIGFVQFDVKAPDLRAMRIVSEKFALCVPTGHPLQHKTFARLSDIKDEKLIVLTRVLAPVYIDMLTDLFRENGLEMNIQHECAIFMSAINLVANGLGVCIAPESMGNMPLNGVSFIPLRGVEATSDVWCVWLAAREKERAIQILLNEVGAFARVAAPHAQVSYDQAESLG